MLTLIFCGILIFTSFSMVCEVKAPPVGGASFAGFITGTETNVTIPLVDVNMTAHLLPDTYSGYQCRITLNGTATMTNPSDESAMIMILYSPVWGMLNTYCHESNISIWSDLAGFSMQQSSLSNITHPRNLSSAFHDRFPDWVWVSDEIWSPGRNFTSINMTLPPLSTTNVYFEDSFTVKSYPVDYFEVGFGLSAAQAQHDKTELRIKIELEIIPNFHSVSFNPEDDVTITQLDNDFFGSWTITYPYSGEFLYGTSPEPIRAGCSGYIKINDYQYLPIPSVTTDTSTGLTDESNTDLLALQTIGIGIALGTVLCVIILFGYLRRS